jgi:CDP-diacylglycerol---serine O-phosphatidyltransferase
MIPPPDRGQDTDLADREDPYHVTRASRIFFWPNLMTAGNLFCGFMSVLHCIDARLAESSITGEYLDSSAPDHYRAAVWFIVGAFAFDSLDGRLARLGGRESLFGAEFDSLADVVSFGVAPTLLMFFLILSPTQGIPWFREIGWFIGFIYLLCAAMRLARFNVITNPLLRRSQKELGGDFVGLPVPAAAITVASTVRFLLRLADADKSLNRVALVLPFLMIMVAILMMSSVRYPSGKKVDLQTETQLRRLVGVVIFVGFFVLFKDVAAICTCLAYIFFGLIRHWRRHRGIRSRAAAARNV